MPHTLWIEVKKGSANVNDITVTFSSFDNGDDEYVTRQNTAINVTIYRDDADGDFVASDSKNKEVEWLVGQTVYQQVSVTAPTSWINSLTYQWTVPGTILHDYDRPTGVSSPVVNTLNTGPNRNTIEFYWVCTTAVGGTDVDPLSVLVKGINGSLNLTVSNTYNVHSPVSSVTASMGAAGIDATGSKVGLVASTTQPVAGIVFSGSVTTPTGFANGAWSQLQTYSPDRSYYLFGWKRWIMSGSKVWGLDNFDTYPASPTTPFNALGGTAWGADGITKTTDDSPGTAIVPGVLQYSLDDQVFTFVLFKAPGTMSKWVPLRSLGWRFKVDIKLNGTTWTTPFGLPSQSMTPANGVFLPETWSPAWPQVHSNNPGFLPG